MNSGFDFPISLVSLTCRISFILEILTYALHPVRDGDVYFIHTVTSHSHSSLILVGRVRVFLLGVYSTSILAGSTTNSIISFSVSIPVGDN
jgi:hypothetical protein